MSFVSSSIISEGLLRSEYVVKGITGTVVASSTLVMTNASTEIQLFTGTVAGQIVTMPDATTLPKIGATYKLINDSTQNVTVQNSAAGAILLLEAGQRIDITCINVGSAAGSWSYSLTASTLAASSAADFDTTYGGSGLSVTYMGGVYRFDGTVTQVAGGAIALPNNTTGTLYVDVDGVVKATASLPAGAMPLYAFITAAGAVTTLTSVRETYENNNVYGVVADISAVDASNSASAGVLNKIARADHVHASTLPLYKSGVKAFGDFAGTPKKVTVTFGTAFADANYSVSVIGVDGRSWVVETVAAGSFVINSQADTALTGNVYWEATAHGQSV